MNKKILAATCVGLFAASTIVVPTAMAKHNDNNGQNQLDLCHITDDGGDKAYTIIEVGARSFLAHQKHGDASYDVKADECQFLPQPA